MHTAILSRLRRIWETALANGIEPGAMPPPQPKAVTPAQTQIARRRVKKRIEEPDALMRLPYWLLTSRVGNKRAEGSGAQRATTPYKSFFLLLLFPRT